MPRLPSLCFPLVLLLSGSLSAQLRQVAIIDIPGRPGFDSMAFARGYLLIAHHGANAADIFDPKLRRLKAQVTGLSDPRGIAVDDVAGRVYIANAGNNTVAVLSSQDWKVVDTISLKYSPDTLLLAGGRLYAGDWLNDSLSIVDLEHQNAVTTVPLGGRPQHMVFDPASNLVFVNLEDLGQVMALDTSNRVARRYALAASQPTGLALDARERRLFVAVRYAVLALDADSGKELARVPAAGGIDTLWFDEAHGVLYAAASDGSVSVIRARGGQFLSQDELRTQVRGHALAYDPGRKMVYLSGGREGRSKLVILKPIDTQGVLADGSADASKAAVTAEKK